MKNYRLHTPEGMKDTLCENAALKHKMGGGILNVLRQHSYHLLETPTFEYLDVFSLNKGTLQSPDLYQFINKEGELVALRNDMTCAIARVVATQNSTLAFPQRYCYLANSFRYPKRYQGKGHEFTQAGIEIIGDNSIESDAEVIKLAIEAIQEAGIKELTLHLGSSSFLKHLVEDIGLADEQQKKIYEAIDHKDGVKVKMVLEEAKVDPEIVEVISHLIQRVGSIEWLYKVREVIKGERTRASLDYLERLYQVLEDYGVNQYVQLDFSLLSYASYYTGIMFQVFIPEIGAAVVEGGRYNNLLSQYGKDLPAVGFGINLDLLLQKLKQDGGIQSINSHTTLIVYDDPTRKLALKIGNVFRNQGMIVENALSLSVEEALSYGKKVGIGGLLYFKSEKEVEIYDLNDGSIRCIDPINLMD